MKYYIYNSLANNGIKPDLKNDINLVEAVGLNYKKFFSELKPEDEVVLVGGDGTLNYFINHVELENIKNKIYLLGAGTGNDFLKDIEQPAGKEIEINKYLCNLPTVTIKDKTSKFINGVGYGIDGYCCEVADKIKEKSPNKKINYTSIAIKGLLFFFKPCHCTVEVDGQKFEYDNVWLAPIMKGRYYGGGMKVSPNQDRFGETISVVVYKSKSKLKALMSFPSIFEGTHINNEKIVKIHSGKKVHVTYSRPCAAQIDGDTVLDVSEYFAEIK